MTPSKSAGTYSAEDRAYAPIELMQAREAAYLRGLGERSKGHLSEAELAELGRLPKPSEAEVDAWLAEYAQPIRPAGAKTIIHLSVYQRKPSYTPASARVAAVLAAGILSFSGVSTAYQGSAVVPQIRSMQTDVETVKDGAALLALGFAGVSLGKSAARVQQQDSDRKSFWKKHVS